MFKTILLGCLIWLFPVTALPDDEKPAIPRFVMGVFLPGINDEVNLSDIRVAMDYWVQQVSQDVNVADSHTEFFDDINEMSQSFTNKNLDMIVAPPLSIARHFNLEELGDGFVGVRNDGQLNSLILLVKNDPAINSLAELKGKRLTMPEHDELSEVYIDTQTRKLNQLGYQQFFGNVAYQPKNNRLILDLFFGKADAALVYLRAYDLMVELNPQVKTSTKILLSYPVRSKSYSFFSRNFDNTAVILRNLTKFTESARGHQILEIFKTEQIVSAKVQELAPIKAIYQEYIRLKANNKK